ncbi:predicted protein [Botrytis cinerea T4]|uniref:Uncharacterized protein n=1 Tax=Botryotinia fuckeliana (strain T4) TaxID=999810 RepID=G2Y5Z3_BOTF4|nr:predicted protein [Botrytis cinerea T4]
MYFGNATWGHCKNGARTNDSHPVDFYAPDPKDYLFRVVLIVLKKLTHEVSTSISILIRVWPFSSVPLRWNVFLKWKNVAVKDLT